MDALIADFWRVWTLDRCNLLWNIVYDMMMYLPMQLINSAVPTASKKNKNREEKEKKKYNFLNFN